MKSKTTVLIGFAFIAFILVTYPYPHMRNVDYFSINGLAQLLGVILLDALIVFAVPLIISFIVFFFDKKFPDTAFFILVIIFCSVLWSFRPKNRALLPSDTQNNAFILQKSNVSFIKPSDNLSGLISSQNFKLVKLDSLDDSNGLKKKNKADKELFFPDDYFKINCNCDFRKDTYNSEATMNTYQCFSYVDTCIYRVNVHNLTKMGLTKSEINNFVNETIENYKNKNTSFKEKLFGDFKAVEYFEYAPNNVTSKNLLLVANGRCYTFSMVSDSEKIKKHWTSFIESITITK